ncbi:hypothetical protein Nepgr_020080 [Nepenthes gracilis]|uniref:Uncharacterized protein n=1 Tax=Nepenthes gracilis TaxID=150966 RepID=A0AAD3XVP6_NEPGR|nr:hypothetical protein Nepgr_020080 [Nepenthes gracilis]
MMDGLPALGLEVNEAQCAFAKPETTSFVLVPGGRKSLITSSPGMAASTLLLPLSLTWKLSCKGRNFISDHFERVENTCR